MWTEKIQPVNYTKSLGERERDRERERQTERERDREREAERLKRKTFSSSIEKKVL